MTKSPVMKCFGDMCQHWLKNDERKTWQVVYTALDQRSNKRLAQDLKDNYGEDGDKIGMKILMILFLYMTSLLMYVVDIPLAKFMEELDEMAHDWYMLGTSLGIPGKILKRIQNRAGLYVFLTNMLEMWLDTGEATWEQLEHALTVVGNKSLANVVKELKEG